MGTTATGRSLSQWVAVLSPLLVTVLLYPVVVFFVHYIVGGVSAAEALLGIVGGEYGSWENLVFVWSFCAIPFVVLSVVLFSHSRRGSTRATWCLAIGGLGGILFTLIPDYASMEAYVYGPGRLSSTAGLGYVFAPIYALPGLAVGLFIGWLVSRLPWFRRAEGGPMTRPFVPGLGSLIMAGVGVATAVVWVRQARDAHDVYRIAASPETTADELQELAKIDDPKLRAYILEHANVDGEILRGLAVDPRVESQVASHPLTPVDVLRDYAERDSPAIDASLAGNPGTPGDILERLSEAESPWIRKNVAGNPSTPAGILEELYRESLGDSVTPLHEALADNPSTPTPLLGELYHRFRQDPWRDPLGGRDALMDLGANPGAPQSVITAFAESDNRFERRAAAQNPSASAAVLEGMVRDDPMVKFAVAGNPNTPQTALEALGKDPDRRLRRAVAYNPSFVGATITLTGVELLRQPGVWTAVKTGQESFFLVNPVNRSIREANLESYSFNSLRYRTGADDVDLAAIAADILTYVNDSPDARFMNPSHRTLTVGDREWGWTRFQSEGDRVLDYIYAPACDRVISLRFSHSPGTDSQGRHQAEFASLTHWLSQVREACGNGEPLGREVVETDAARSRVIVQSDRILRGTRPPNDGLTRNEAAIVFESLSGDPLPTLEWNGRPVRVSGERGIVAVVGTDGDLVASTDLTAFDDIVLIRAGPFCRGRDGRHALAVYAQLGGTGGRAMFLVYAPDGRPVYQEYLGPAAGTGLFLDRASQSGTLIVEHGGVSSYQCVIDGVWDPK